MATALQTPFGAPACAVELSSSGLWRKQILPFTTIDYVGRNGKPRKITFDEGYVRELIRSFKAKAYSQVPFQLADGDNNHNNDPRNTGGELVGVELSSDGTGLDGIFRLWGQGEQVVTSNQKLGVSARIIENLVQPDGRAFPRALQHVLGTVDPQTVTDRPWQKVDLSNTAEVEEQLDMSDLQYGRAGMPTATDDKTEVLELSPAQAARLRKLLEQDEAKDELAGLLDDQGFFDDSDDEDETDEDESNDEDDNSGSDTNLSNGNGGNAALELANAQLSSHGQQILELTNALNEQRTQTEVDEFGRRGLAPAVLEAARPLLSVPTGAIELSNSTGTQVDPAEVLRDVLNTVVDLASTGQLLIDFDEIGSVTGAGPGTDSKQAERDAMVNDWANTYG